MKFSSQIIALIAIPTMGASAFMVGGPKAQTTALQSSSYFASMDDSTATSASAPGPAGAGSMTTGGKAAMQKAKDIWDTDSPVKVQGGSLRTWSLASPTVERVQVFMKTEGRPLNANVELWQGPDNTPQKMGVYCEDASLRPFSAVIETPRDSNAVAIRNTGHLEFPLDAVVEAELEGTAGGVGPVNERLSDINVLKTIQGGAIVTYPFAPSVKSVQVLLKTDGRPLNSRIELLQGPNNNKQVMEIYTEDGMERPFYAVIETPGVGNVVRIVNTATVEFPLTAAVEPFLVEEGSGGLSGGAPLFFLD